LLLVYSEENNGTEGTLVAGVAADDADAANVIDAD